MARILTLRPKQTRPDFLLMAIEFTVLEETDGYYRVVPTALPLDRPVVVQKNAWDEVKP
jgi:hypothetical protein